MKTFLRLVLTEVMFLESTEGAQDVCDLVSSLLVVCERGVFGLRPRLLSWRSASGFLPG